MTTGKTVALSIRTFVGKVMSLLFIMRTRLVLAFLPRVKCLLISWLQSPSAGWWTIVHMLRYVMLSHFSRVRLCATP